MNKYLQMTRYLPARITPLDNLISKQGFVRSDRRNSPANQLAHQMQVDRYKRWREHMLVKTMRDDMKQRGQTL